MLLVLVLIFSFGLTVTFCGTESEKKANLAIVIMVAGYHITVPFRILYALQGRKIRVLWFSLSGSELDWIDIRIEVL